MFPESFQGSHTQFLSQRLVMLQTDVFVTANGQIIPESFDVTNMLLFIHTVCLHLEQAFETLLKEVKLDIDVLEETVAL